VLIGAGPKVEVRQVHRLVIVGSAKPPLDRIIHQLAGFLTATVLGTKHRNGLLSHRRVDARNGVEPSRDFGRNPLRAI
jgi:hypothetical protein